MSNFKSSVTDKTFSQKKKKNGKLLKVCKKVICNDPRKNASHICAIPQKD